MATSSQIKKVTLSFMGGVEESFGTRSMEIEIPVNIKKMTPFIRYLYEETLKDNPGRDEIFVDESTVKPGILVLHNNRDINLFMQATEDSGNEESEDEEPFQYPEELSTSFKEKMPLPPEPKPEEEKEKLRISDGDEISFLSIIHGG